MDSFDLVSSLQTLPETDPTDIDGIQFGPTCVNIQTNGGSDGCQFFTINMQVLQTVNNGIGIGIGIGGAVFSQGC